MATAIMGISRSKGRESGIGKRRKPADWREFLTQAIGQHYPTHCPTQPGPFPGQPTASGAESRLGTPLDIRQVARLVGCSPWSIRNTWIPRGLPHFRSGASSKLLFYTEQVVRWIENQQKGGSRM
jgi:hypothetical protein